MLLRWTWRLRTSIFPTVYVSAVLFRKITDLSIPLLAGHGFAPLMVERKSNKLDVQIRAPEKIRPRTKQTVTVPCRENRACMLTLAAVDEGICQVKNYKTPDPYAYFYARKALETETFDFFKHLLPELHEERNHGAARAAVRRRWGSGQTPLVCNASSRLHSGPASCARTGTERSTIPLDIPEFSGELRLMAFAYKGDRFGSAERAMKIADPIVITPALPRFASPGDVVRHAPHGIQHHRNADNASLRCDDRRSLAAAQKNPELEVGANEERFVPVQLHGWPGDRQGDGEDQDEGLWRDRGIHRPRSLSARSRHSGRMYRRGMSRAAKSRDARRCLTSTSGRAGGHTWPSVRSLSPHSRAN